MLKLFKNENMLLKGTVEESMNEHFMIDHSSQSYISRCLIDYISPKGDIITTMTAIDSGSSLTLAVEALLHALREKDLGSVRGFAGSMRLNRIGDLIIPHPFAGSSILKTACVSGNLLPSGTRALIGRGGTHSLHISNDAISDMPPSITARPAYKFKAPHTNIDWSKTYVNGRNGLTHPVCWDGVRDNRIGERAFVRF